MKAKVFIDEIICWKCGIPPADFEIDQYAIPRLKALDLPGTKITVSETTMEDYVTYYQEGVTQKKLNNGIYNYNTHIRLLEQNELFRQEIKSKDIANIRGMDKPKIIKHNGLTYAYLLDVDLEPNPHTINFFSDDPAIQSKQSHLLLKGDESIGRKHPGIDFPAKRLLYDDDAFMTFKGKIIRYANVKEKIALNYLKDENPKIIDLWYQNIEHLSQHTNGKWWNKESPELSTIGVFSELHCLDHHETKKIEQLYPKGFRND